jgi:hypothetical protein
MQAAMTNNNALVQHCSVVDMVARLRADFSNTKSELNNARIENNRLKRALKRQQSQNDITTEFDLPSLRRAVAFYCHPDRGGSDVIMSKVNTFFDFLARQDQP